MWETLKYLQQIKIACTEKPKAYSNWGVPATSVQNILVVLLLSENMNICTKLHFCPLFLYWYESFSQLRKNTGWWCPGTGQWWRHLQRAGGVGGGDGRPNAAWASWYVLVTKYSMIKWGMIILQGMSQVWRRRKEKTASKVWFDGPTMLM